jgi:hypothetical protein
VVGEDLDARPDGPCAGLTNGRAPVRMPYGGAKLPEDQIDQVRSWILAGARCDTSPSDGGIDAGDTGTDAAVDGGTPVEVATLTSPTRSLVAGQRATLTVTLASPAPPVGQPISLEAEDATALGVPSSTFVIAGQLSTTFQVQGLRPARPTRIRAHSGSLTAEVQIGVGGLVLAELLYNASGGDDGEQWLKLTNTSSVPVDLSQYSLGAGKASYLEVTAHPSGVLAPDACFVIGGPDSSGDNGWPTYSQVLHFKPAIPHGGAHSATGMAIFDVATAKADTLPLDTVVYGRANGGGLVRPDGSVALPDAADALAGHSLVRTSGGWQDAAIPTPSVCHP